MASKLTLASSCFLLLLVADRRVTLECDILGFLPKDLNILNPRKFFEFKLTMAKLLALPLPTDTPIFRRETHTHGSYSAVVRSMDELRAESLIELNH